MSQDIVQKHEPQMMVISPFSSNISNKMRHLSSSIKDTKDGATRKIYIIPFTEIVDGVTIKKIRIKDDIGSWCEFSPYDPSDGELIEKTVSVNMYDFYNSVENCLDEFITLWIDQDTNELVLNSFYNPDTDVDELEVRFKLLPVSIFNEQSGPSTQDKPIHTFRLNAITTTMIMQELNVERDGGGVIIKVHAGKMYFQNSYHGLISQMTVKDMQDQVFEDDFSIYIPFNAFQLMTSTGYVYELQFNYYSNGQLLLETDEYKFCYQTSIPPLDFFIDPSNPEISEMKDYFVVESEMIETGIGLVNRLNKSGYVTHVTIEYVDPTCADLYCEVNNRISISSRTKLAMLSEENFTIDSDILQEITSKTGVDAIRVKRIDDNSLYMKYENKTITKEIIYYHNEFSQYRAIKLKEWIKRND